MKLQEQMLLTKYDLMFESRLTRVEINLVSAENNLCKAMKEIKNNLRWMFGIMLCFNGILLGLIGRELHWFV